MTDGVFLETSLVRLIVSDRWGEHLLNVVRITSFEVLARRVQDHFSRCWRTSQSEMTGQHFIG